MAGGHKKNMFSQQDSEAQFINQDDEDDEDDEEEEGEEDYGGEDAHVEY